MSINYYKVFKSPKPAHNPGFKNHGINVPFRMLIIGSTGSGKTNLLVNLLHLMSGTFKDIAICLRSKEEPLYQYLDDKIKEGLTFYEIDTYKDLPTVNDIESDSLIVFDDLVLEKNQSKIAEFFIRGRKKNISCVYISQSYYQTPKIIRTQCNYIVLKKINSNKDLSLILSEFPIDRTLDEIKQIYHNCSKGIQQFLFIDINKNTFHCNSFNGN